MIERKYALGVLRSMRKENSLSVRVKVGMLDGTLVLMVLHGSEVLAIVDIMQERVDVLEVNCLRICSARRVDQIRNDRIREMCL